MMQQQLLKRAVNNPAIIPYGQRRKRRMRLAWFLVIVACAASYFLRTAVPRLVNEIRTHYWLSRMKAFGRPADEVVYTDDAAEGKKLEAAGGYAKGSLNSRPIVYRVPEEWRYVMSREFDPLGIILLHQAPGDDSLIYCSVSDWSEARLDQPTARALVIDGGTLSYDAVHAPVRPVIITGQVWMTQMLRILLQPRDNVTIYAAQASADGKSFTFDLMISKSRYTIEVSRDVNGQVQYHTQQGKLIPSNANDPNSMNVWDPNG
jgi:hypothetical protein